MGIYAENQMTVTLKLKRIDVCNILIALRAADRCTEETKYAPVHQKVLEQLKEHDERRAVERRGEERC